VAGHDFCVDCFEDAAHQVINDSAAVFPMRCPKQDCHTAIHINDLQQQVCLSAGVFVVLILSVCSRQVLVTKCFVEFCSICS
jgi:hypothetical protein